MEEKKNISAPGEDDVQDYKLITSAKDLLDASSRM